MGSETQSSGGVQRGAEIIEGKPKMVKFNTPNSNAKRKNELYIYKTSNSFSLLQELPTHFLLTSTSNTYF